MSESPFDAERLADHAGFVRALARSLLRGERGDDVAQETLALALARPPARDAGPRGLRAWLATVTRRLAGDEQRGAERRDRREKNAARTEAVAPAADVAARMETMRRLLVALAELPEPDRVVLVMRFYDALPPRRIAAALAIPVNTVRTRLQRALERLRANYFDGAAHPPGLNQAHEREQRLAGLALLVGGGAVVMGVKQGVVVSAAAAVVGLLTVGGVMWRWHAPMQERRDPPVAAATLVESAQPPAATVEDVTRSATERSASEEVVRDGRFVHLRGRICDRAGKVIHPESEVAVLVRYFPPASSAALRSNGLNLEIFAARVANDGTFEVRVPAVREERGGALARLQVKHEPRGFLAVSRTLPVPDASAWPKAGDLELECEIVALRASTISGRIVDDLGKPFDDGMVAALFRREGSELVLVPGTERTIQQGIQPESNEMPREGSFSLAVASSGQFELVVTPPSVDEYAPRIDRGTLRALSFLPLHRSIEVHADEAIDLGDLVVERGESIRGRLVVDKPWSAAGAVVRARRHDPRDESDPAWLGSPRQCGVLLPAFERAGGGGIANEDGEFEIVGLTPGTWFVSVANLADARVIPGLGRQSIVEVEAPDEQVELRLGGALVQIDVRHEGKPLSGAHLIASMKSAEGSIAASVGSGRENVIDRTGHAVVAVPSDIAVTLRASCVGFVAQTRSLGMLASGQVLDVAFDLAPIALHRSVVVDVRTVAGMPIERCDLRLTSDRPNGARNNDLGMTADDRPGRFVASNVEPGHWLLRARPGGDFIGGEGFYEEMSLELDVVEGEVAEVEFVAQPAGHLRVSARRDDGTPLAARFELRDGRGCVVETALVFREEDGSGRWLGSTHGDEALGEGECLVDPPLAPGNYTATLELAGYRRVVQPFVITASRCTFVDAILDRE